MMFLIDLLSGHHSYLMGLIDVDGCQGFLLTLVSKSLVMIWGCGLSLGIQFCYILGDFIVEDLWITIMIYRAQALLLG